MTLSNYFFPIEERPIAVHNGKDKNQSFNSPIRPNGYKAIVRADTNETISVVKSSYKIATNEKIIKDLFTQLIPLGNAFNIDQSHSFVQNNRMRLQVTFPDITIRDKDSSIALSLFLSNSYDMSEGVRVYFGAIRAICSNGMVFGKVLNQFYGRHTKNFDLGNISSSIRKTVEELPAIQNRIRELEYSPVTPDLQESVEAHLGKTIARKVLETDRPLSQWELYNNITHIISHDMEQHLRARYQQQVAKVFAL
jgi:hypothetical protein